MNQGSLSEEIRDARRAAEARIEHLKAEIEEQWGIIHSLQKSCQHEGTEVKPKHGLDWFHCPHCDLYITKPPQT